MIPSVLTPEIATLGIGLGLMFSLVWYLMTNLSPGGMITPGWLALTLVDDVRHTAVIVGATALTYAGTLLMQRHVILYGKRLFATVLLTGLLLQATAAAALPSEGAPGQEGQPLGYIVPGLIAYQLVRQPKGPTLLATGTVTLAAYNVLAAGIVLGAVPSA